MIHSTTENPKIAELIVELQTLKATYHGFTMAVAREADVNYNNLSSMLSMNEEGTPKRKMGYHVFFSIKHVLPKVKKEFSKRKVKKV